MYRLAGMVLALASGLPALDIPKDGSYVFQALNGADISQVPDRPLSAKGTVEAAYQGLALGCDQLDYQLAQVPGLSSVTVGRAVLTPPAGGRVLLDSRAATLPLVPVRGRLTPERATITRRDAPAGIVRWQVDLDRLDDATLELRTREGWARHHVWAEQAHLVIEAPIVLQALGPMRLVSADFIGHPDPGDGSGRLAAMERFAPDAAANAAPIGSAEADRLHLMADPEGRISVKTEGLSRFRGIGLADLKAP